MRKPKQTKLCMGIGQFFFSFLFMAPNTYKVAKRGLTCKKQGGFMAGGGNLMIHLKIAIYSPIYGRQGGVILAGLNKSRCIKPTMQYTAAA